MQYLYLAHHGIKGQKWGVRRYQNPDGTLTEEGRKRYRNIVEKTGPYGDNGKRYWQAFDALKKDRDLRKSELMDSSGKLTKKGEEEYGMKRDRTGRAYLTEYGRKLYDDDRPLIPDTAATDIWKERKFSKDPATAYKQASDYYDQLFQDGRMFSEELWKTAAFMDSVAIIEKYNKTFPNGKEFVSESNLTDKKLNELYNKYYFS